MKDVPDRHSRSTEATRVLVTAYLQHPTPHVLGVAGQEAFDVDTIDRTAAVVAELEADGIDTPEVPHPDPSRPGGSSREAKPRLLDEHPKDSDGRSHHHVADGMEPGEPEVAPLPGEDEVDHRFPGVVAPPLADPLGERRFAARVPRHVRLLPPQDCEGRLQHSRDVFRHVGSVPAIVREDLGIEPHRVVASQSQHEVVVLADPERCVEPPRFLQSIAPVHHRRVHPHGVAAQECLVPVGAGVLGVGAGDRLELPVDEPVRSVHERALGRARELLEVRLEGARPQEVVRVEKDEIPASSGAPAGVARGGQSLVLLADEPHGGHSRHHRRGIVGRPVVDDDHLQGADGLGANAGEGVAEERGLVERGDDDGDRGRHRRNPPAPARIFHPRIADVLNCSRADTAPLPPVILALAGRRGVYTVFVYAVTERPPSSSGSGSS